MIATNSALRTLTTTLVLLAGASAHAQGSGGGVPAQTLPWSKVQQIVQHFEAIAPAPPPLETVLLGTFDAATGDFIWGPNLELWEVPVDLPYDDIAVAPAFELRGIQPLSVDLSPQLSGLSSIGISAQVALQGQGPASLAKPATPAAKSKPKGKLDPKVDTLPLPQATQTQRFRGHPLDKGVMRTFVRAAKIAFVVEVVNRQPEQSVVLSIDGSTVQAAADLIDVIVPPRTRHFFEIKSANLLFAEKLFVFRPPLIGTFTLEALPITTVYEPPGGEGCSQTYTSVHRAGTEIRSFQSNEASATQPIDTPITTLNEYCEIAKTVGGAASSVPNPYVSGAGSVVSGAAGVLQAAFGSLEISQSVSSTVTDTHTLAIEVTEGDSTTTSAGVGPGQGDVFHCLLKPTFAWIVAQDFESGAVFVSTALLGHAGVAKFTARDLREHKVAVLPTEIQDLLLALDPLAPEYPAAALSSKSVKFDITGRLGSTQRVVPLAAPLVYLSNAESSFWLAHTLTASDENARVDVITTTTKSSAGFLSYVTSAVPKDEDSKMSVRQGGSSLTSTSDTVEVKVDLVASGDDALLMEVGYDRLFGTFTFHELESQPQFMSGSVSDGSGTPLGAEPMLLSFADGRTMQARTDSLGKFSIRPPLKVAGPILVQSGGARTTIDWNGASRSGVELRGAVAQAASGTSSGSKPGGRKPSGGTSFPDPSSVPVKASEGTTAGAIRGRPAVVSAEAARGVVTLRNRLTGRVMQLRDAALAKELKVGEELESDAGMTRLTKIRGLDTMVALFEPDEASPCCGVVAVLQDKATMQALLGGIFANPTGNPAEPVGKPKSIPAGAINGMRDVKSSLDPAEPAESIGVLILVRDTTSGALHVLDMSVLDPGTGGSIAAPITSSIKLGDPVSIDTAAGIALLKTHGGTYAFNLLGVKQSAEPSSPSEAWEIAADPTMKGRLGRLVVNFPEGAAIGDAVEMFVGEKKIGYSYGNLSEDLIPGDYAVVLNKHRVENVEVRTGHVTRVHAGVLRVIGPSGTTFRLFEPGAEESFTYSYGSKDFGLLPGEVEVDVAGQRAKIEIVAGRIVEF